MSKLGSAKTDHAHTRLQRFALLGAVDINFVYYEKAFDSLDKETLWKLLRHYLVLTKIVSIVRKSNEGLTCTVVHRGQLTVAFHVRTGVRQG